MHSLKLLLNFIFFYFLPENIGIFPFINLSAKIPPVLSEKFLMFKLKMKPCVKLWNILDKNLEGVFASLTIACKYFIFFRSSIAKEHNNTIKTLRYPWDVIYLNMYFANFKKSTPEIDEQPEDLLPPVLSRVNKETVNFKKYKYWIIFRMFVKMLQIIIYYIY